MSDWWSTAPIASPEAGNGDDWYKSAPLAEEKPAKPNIESPFPQPVMDKANQFAMSPGEFDMAKYGSGMVDVAKAFGKSFGETWGPERLGLSDKSIEEGRKWGLFRNLEDDKLNPFKALNETLFGAAAYVLDAANRGAQASYAGAQAAAVAMGLPKDVASIPDAFMGSPHPTGIPKPFVKPTPIESVKIADTPTPIARPRSELAKTGIPHVDALLDSEPAKSVIDNPVIDRSRTVPNAWSGSDPPENPTTYLDKTFPKEIEVGGVKWDPAEPAAVRENAEEMAYDTMVADGMSPDAAQRVAFHDVGNPVENAWYEAHGIDPEKANAAMKSDIDRITALGVKESGSQQIRSELNRYFNDEIGKDELSPEARSIYDKMPDGIKQASEDIVSNSNKFDRFLTEDDILEDEDLAPLRDERRRKAEEARPKVEQWFKENVSDVPPDMFTGMYPDGDPAKTEPGEIGKPTAEESEQGRKILEQKFMNRRAATVQDVLNTARDLDVIGPPKPEPAFDGSPAEQAETAWPTDLGSAATPAEDRPAMRGHAKGEYDQRGKEWVSKIDAPNDVRAAIEGIANDHDWFPEARGGVASPAARKAVAEAAGVDPASMDGDYFAQHFDSDGKVRAVIQALRQTAKDATEASAKNVAEPSPENAAAAAEAQMRHTHVLEYTMGLRAESGRTLAAWKDLLKGTEIGKEERAAKLLAIAGKPIDLTGLTPDQAARVLAQVRRFKESPADKQPWYYWIRNQGLISGLITHTKYAMVNTSMVAMERWAAPTIAAGIGKLRGEDASLMAPTYGMMSMFNQIPDAGRAAVDAFKSNRRMPLASELRLFERGEESPQTKGAINPYDQSQGPDWGIWKRVFNETQLDSAAKAIGIPGRSANAIHTFFKVLSERAALGTRAFEEARKEGVTGDKFWQRYQYHLDNPTDDALRGAVNDAYSGAFMSKLEGNWEKTANSIGNFPVLGPVFFPFRHIPVNIVRKGVEYSPLSVLDKEFRGALMGEKGAPAQNLAFAKMAVGTSIFGYFMMKSYADEMTGPYPHDPDERREWQLTSKQPFSLKIGDQWVSMERLGPLGMVANTAAAFGSAARHYSAQDRRDDVTFNSAAMSASLGAVGVLGNEAGFQSLRDISDAMNGDEKQVAKFLSAQVGSVVPSLLGQFASVKDPYLRKADDLISALKYRVPGLRETLPVKRDPLYGEPLPNPGYGGNPTLGLFRMSQISHDPVRAELDRLKIYPTQPVNNVGGVKLPPEMYDKYQEVHGAFTRQLLEPVVNQPGWLNAPPFARAETIQALRKSATEAAKAQMQGMHQQIIVQGMKDQVSKITGAKKTKLQDANP